MSSDVDGPSNDKVFFYFDIDPITPPDGLKVPESAEPPVCEALSVAKRILLTDLCVELPFNLPHFDLDDSEDTDYDIAEDEHITNLPFYLSASTVQGL